MNKPFKRGMQIMGLVAILGTSACVVDPYYSGIQYDSGYGNGYGYDNDNYYSSTTVIGTGSNFAYNTGFLIGNYYYLDDYYYPIQYYNHGGNRYYRPIFNRPYRYHPDSRYRNLNRAQVEQWRRNQHERFDPNYRPNNWNNRYDATRPRPSRPSIEQGQIIRPQSSIVPNAHQRPWGANTRPQQSLVPSNRPNTIQGIGMTGVQHRPAVQTQTYRPRPAPTQQKRPIRQLNDYYENNNERSIVIQSKPGGSQPAPIRIGR